MSRVITLLGNPIVTEDGEASEAIKPGHLVKGQGTVAKQTTATTKVPVRVALERDELGKGIDSTPGSSLDTNNSVAAQSADYASGDTVKVGAFAGGDRFLGWVASGVNVAADALMESAGDGTVRALTGAEPIVRALEAVNATADTRIRLEVI